MKNKSLVKRILFIYLVSISVYLVFLFFVYSKIVETEVIASETAMLGHYSLLMEERVSELLSGSDSGELQRFVVARSGSLGVRITCIAPDGEVVADSDENPEYMENHSDRPEVRSAAAGKNASVVRYSNTLGKNMLYYAHGITAGGKLVGILRIARFSTVVASLVDDLVVKYAASMCVIALLSAAGFLVIHYNFKREIGRFADISLKVSEGDLDVEFSKDDSYEILELGRSFRLMIGKIRKLIGELVFEKEEIEAIITQVDEGIAVIDEEGRIVRANRSFSRIFDVHQSTGRLYWEIVRVNEITERLQSPDEGENRPIEFQLGAKEFLCSIDNLAERKERVLIFYDLTALKKMQTVKRDLVTNVSHELRTPLTLIKGYVETLLEDERVEDRKKYLGIVLRNAERLNNIIRDLLTLSELESGKGNYVFERIDLRDVINGILPVFGDKLAEKGLSFELHAPEEPCCMTGDPFRLEQVFINLVDNAYKYTNSGGITIAIEKRDKSISVSVNDTGIGIPEEAVTRIFERFYVVDKSRSRAHGGTGLGLSIVKHIVTMHGGEIVVKTSPGEGTSFVITFPAD